MANQIATFFSTQPGEGQAGKVAQHLKDFWEPRMRREILEIAKRDDNNLSPLAREAVGMLGEVPA
jgi:formate dehydrogenase subunit delta